jgi:undecaprenyl pyrophosphate phosphatase UppP
MLRWFGRLSLFKCMMLGVGVGQLFAAVMPGVVHHRLGSALIGALFVSVAFIPKRKEPV